MSGEPYGAQKRVPSKRFERRVDSSVKILEAIKGNEKITAKEIAESIGLSLRAVEKRLAKLKQDGVLNCIGPR